MKMSFSKRLCVLMCALCAIPFACGVSATNYCETPIGSSNCSNVVSMVGDGEQKTTIIFKNNPYHIGTNFNITGIPVCFQISTTESSLVVNWNSSADYEQYAGSITAKLFYNNTASSGECNFEFQNGNGKNICDSEPPVWVEEPSFAYASDRMAVFNVSAADNIGVVGFKVIFNGCDETRVTIVKAKEYTGTIAVPLPNGCPDITNDPTTAEIYAIDVKDNLSEKADVDGIVRTETQPEMVSAECLPNYFENSMVIAVEAKKGSSNVKSYRVKDESAGIDKVIDCGESGTITIDNIQTDHFFTFNVWAVDEKGFESDNFIKCEANCITTSKPAIMTNVTTSYIARGSAVVFTAVGFDAGGVFQWARTDDPNGEWIPLATTTNILTDYPMYAGNNFYKVTSNVNGTPVTVQISILAKVACDVEGSAIQKQVWIESFDDPTLYPFNNIDEDRFECPHIVDYEFATWDNPCGLGKEFGPGKVCDGAYVVVAKSDAAYPEACNWPSGKLDHTSEDGTSGYLIVNLGEEERLVYEQEIKPVNGFCSGVFYNFSLFATNIAPDGCAARFAFDIVKILKSGEQEYIVKGYDSGLIEGFSMSKWYEYGVSFEVNDIDDVNKIVLKLWNTGACDYGNDVVIDDISVSVCSPVAQAFIGDPANGVKSMTDADCGDVLTLNANVKGYIGDFFSKTPYYVWQKSLDDGSSWSVIEGENTEKYIYLTDATEWAKFRCLIASDKATADLVLEGEQETGCGLYSWSDDLFVKCKRNECSQFPSVSLSTDKPKLTCAVNVVTLKAEATGGTGSGYTYKWDNGQYEVDKSEKQVNMTGTYYVQVKDSKNCVSRLESITVEEDTDEPEVSITPEEPVLTCVNATVTLNAVATDVTYKWSTGATTQSITVKEGGVYEVEVTSQTNGCTGATEVEVEDKTDKTVWPTIVAPYDGNGLNDDFVTGEGVSIKLFDRTGNMVFSGNDGIPESALIKLQPAVYFYTATTKDGCERKGTLEIYKK